MTYPEGPLGASGTVTDDAPEGKSEGDNEAILGVVCREFTPIIMPQGPCRRETESLVRDQRERVQQVDGQRQLGRSFFLKFEGTGMSVTVSVLSVGILPTVGEKSPRNGRFQVRKPVLKTGRVTRPTHSEGTATFYSAGKLPARQRGGTVSDFIALCSDIGPLASCLVWRRHVGRSEASRTMLEGKHRKGGPTASTTALAVLC